MTSTNTLYSLRDFNSWRVGGYAQKILLPQTHDDIVASIKTYGQAIHVLGYGSNTLMPIEQPLEVVMVLKKNYAQITPINEQAVIVESGCAAPKVARWAAEKGFNNLNFLIGIPGSIGGCAMMNAGAHHQSLMEEVLWLEVIDIHGQKHRLTPADYQYSYRRLVLPMKGIITRLGLQLRIVEKAWSLNQVLAYRSKTQPLGLWTCGSVFKNPEGFISAGWLIEQVGLKGFSYGDLQVSVKHANFIVNHQNATAQQILKMTRWIQERVYALTGAVLEPEYQSLQPVFK